jgi:hypothetical protein
MDYEHRACAPEVGTEIEARDREPGVYVQVATMVEERMPFGERQDVEVSYARGAVVAMGVQAKASEVEPQDAMLLEVAQRHAISSERR